MTLWKKNQKSEYMYMYNWFTFAVEQKLTALQIKKQDKIHAALHLSTRSESQSFHLPLVAEALSKAPLFVSIFSFERRAHCEYWRGQDALQLGQN